MIRSFWPGSDAEAIECFRQFMDANEHDRRLVDLEWYELSVGFFIGLGCPVTAAIALALHVRYTLHYWTPVAIGSGTEGGG